MTTTQDPPREPGTPTLVERLAPFVAWLATRDLDEDTRRRHRASVEAYLHWSRDDGGERSGRRRRYERDLASRDPDALDDAMAGLDRLAEYQAIVAMTLPVHQ